MSFRRATDPFREAKVPKTSSRRRHPGAWPLAQGSRPGGPQVSCKQNRQKKNRDEILIIVIVVGSYEIAFWKSNHLSSPRFFTHIFWVAVSHIFTSWMTCPTCARPWLKLLRSATAAAVHTAAVAKRAAAKEPSNRRVSAAWQLAMEAKLLLSILGSGVCLPHFFGFWFGMTTNIIRDYVEISIDFGWNQYGWTVKELRKQAWIWKKVRLKNHILCMFLVFPYYLNKCSFYQRKFRNLTSDYTESCCWRSVNQQMWLRRCDIAEMWDMRIWRVGSARNAVFYHTFVTSPAPKVRS